MARAMRGRIPERGQVVAAFGEWDLWKFDRNPSYIDLKLVLTEGYTDKANYWVSYSLAERRWVNSADLFIMQQRRPRMYAFLEQWLAAELGRLEADDAPARVLEPTDAARCEG